MSGGRGAPRPPPAARCPNRVGLGSVSGHKPTQFAVRSIPTLLIFKGGKVVGQHIGAAPKSKLVQFVNAHANAA